MKRVIKYEKTRFYVDEEVYQTLNNDNELYLNIVVNPIRGKHPQGYYFLPNDIAIKFIESKRKDENSEWRYNWKKNKNYHQDGIPKALRDYFIQA